MTRRNGAYEPSKLLQPEHGNDVKQNHQAGEQQGKNKAALPTAAQRLGREAKAAPRFTPLSGWVYVAVRHQLDNLSSGLSAVMVMTGRGEAQGLHCGLDPSLTPVAESEDQRNLAAGT